MSWKLADELVEEEEAGVVEVGGEVEAAVVAADQAVVVAGLAADQAAATQAASPTPIPSSSGAAVPGEPTLEQSSPLVEVGL